MTSPAQPRSPTGQPSGTEPGPARPDRARAGRSSASTRPVLIGIGNRDRGDDSIGPLVADAVRGRTDRVVTIVREGDLAVLPLLWEDDDDVLIVDACRSDDEVGSVHRIDPDELPIGVELSTHGVSVAEAIQLADRLGRRPARLRMLGVTGRDFGFGPISPPMRRALPAIVDEVLAAFD